MLCSLNHWFEGENTLCHGSNSKTVFKIQARERRKDFDQKCSRATLWTRLTLQPGSMPHCKILVFLQAVLCCGLLYTSICFAHSKWHMDDGCNSTSIHHMFCGIVTCTYIFYIQYSGQWLIWLGYYILSFYIYRCVVSIGFMSTHKTIVYVCVCMSQKDIRFQDCDLEFLIELE